MKRLATFLLVAGAALAPAQTPRADDPATVRLTLEDAMARARASSSRLSSYTALSRAASSGIRSAEAAGRGEIDVAASYARNSNVPELVLSSPGAPPRTIFPNLPNNWRAHAGATYPVYTGGRVGSQILAARETERAAQSDRAAFESDLRAETQVAYVNVLFARENARVLREAVASYEAHLKDALNRQSLGFSASNETLAVTVERERAELGRVQAESAAAIASANLLRLVGLPSGTSLELQSLPDGPTPGPVDLEDLVKKAGASRPELEALKARVGALDAAVSVARSASRPQAGLQASYDFANPNPRILPLAGDWKDSWSVGLSVSLKVLDGGRASAQAAQAQAQADALRAQLADLESRIRLEVTTRRIDLDTALAGKAVALRGIEAARDAVRVARDRYKEGVLSSSELLDAETRQLRAELEVAQNDAQIQIALANLARAVGGAQ